MAFSSLEVIVGQRITGRPAVRFAYRFRCLGWTKKGGLR